MTTIKLDTTQELAACLNLLRTAAMVERHMSRQLVHGMALPELLLLLYVRLAPDGRLRRVDIAERLGMSQSSVTRLLGPLERRKIIVRSTDESDARAVYTELTPAGIEVVDEAISSAELAAEDLFEGIGDDELESASRFLRHLAGGVPGSFRA